MCTFSQALEQSSIHVITQFLGLRCYTWKIFAKWEDLLKVHVCIGRELAVCTYTGQSRSLLQHRWPHKYSTPPMFIHIHEWTSGEKGLISNDSEKSLCMYKSNSNLVKTVIPSIHYKPWEIFVNFLIIRDKFLIQHCWIANTHIFLIDNYFLLYWACSLTNKQLTRWTCKHNNYK